jgi:hypothetical protein
MKDDFVKIMAALIFSSLLMTNSCQIDMFEGEHQVYNEDGTPFNGTINVTGIPYTFPGNSLDPSRCPWEIQGRINNGKIAISFQNNKLELNSKYENDFTEGVRIGKIFIEQKNNSSLRIALHKINKGGYDEIDILNEVAILYSSDDFHKPDDYYYGEYALKAGWNFIEIVENPNWFYGSDERYTNIGLISQNINDFLKKGYRWQIEYWF